MSEAQSGAALEPYNAYSKSSHLTELSSMGQNEHSTTHLTLLKNAPSNPSSSSPNSANSNSSGLPSLFTFGENDARLGDAFSEIRYAELSHWDLNLNAYSTEGLTARLIDSRPIHSPNGENGGSDPYRPWEKPDTTQSTHQSPTSTSGGGGGGVGATLVSVSVGQTTPTPPENGISSTNDKSPTTLTPLTNVFPTFSDTFHGGNSQGGKLSLPSFQSQFNPFQEPTSSMGESPANSLPSFHTLPVNGRTVGVGYAAHTPTHTPVHPGQMVGQPSQHHPQFLEERHIQIFPGQVQFGQIIAASASPHNGGGHQGVNGHQHHPHAIPVHFGNGGNGHFQQHQQAQAPPPVSTPTTTIHLQELVPVPTATLLHISNNNGKGHHNGTNGSTDGGLILHHTNDPHHHHHIVQQNGGHLHHPPPPPHININMPKYIHGAGIVPGNEHLHPIETHLIAVNPNMLHHAQHTHQTPTLMQMQIHPNSNGTPQQGQQQHNPQKIEQQQSPNNGGGIHANGGIVTPNGTPKRQVTRKRKGLEVQISMDGHSHNDLDPQVSSVSSTDSNDYNGHSHHNNNNNNNNGHRRPMNGMNGGVTPNGGMNGTNGGHMLGMDGLDGLDKPVKKKRKRCGECIGCQRKDNCGDCAPCRNDKSHQICKMRRCDKLTEKKTPKVKLKQQQH